MLTSTSTAYTSCTSNSAFSWSFLQKREDSYHPLITSEGKIAVNLLLLVCRVLDDSFLSIDHMLLELMGQHACNHGKEPHTHSTLFKYKPLQLTGTNCSHALTLNRGTFEGLGDLVPSVSHLCVLIKPACYKKRGAPATLVVCYHNRGPLQWGWESLNSHLVPWFHEAKSSLSTEVSRHHQVSLPASLWVVLRATIFLIC